jgi:hypothetical protein
MYHQQKTSQHMKEKNKYIQQHLKQKTEHLYMKRELKRRKRGRRKCSAHTHTHTDSCYLQLFKTTPHNGNFELIFSSKKKKRDRERERNFFVALN